MSAPCPTCQAVICSDTADDALYSIESALFPFVFECPAGYDCGNAPGFKMVCCGTLFEVDFPTGASADLKTTLIQSIVNQCAVLLAACGQNPGCLNPPCDPPPPTTTLYYNRDATCEAKCPDGTPFFYTVVAGTFADLTQEGADQKALDYACQQVPLRRVCMTAFTNCLCVDAPYSRSIVAIGGLPPIRFTLASGSLPTGLTLSIHGLISGTPTASGVFHFAVKATTGDGGSSTKSFTLSVMEITTTSIPGYTIGTAYTYQMLAAGGSGMYNWSISSGALPEGLSMSATGLITGTPTAAGTNPVEFKLIDTTCEAGVQTLQRPAITMVARSTTQIATVRGYDEFIPSLPPKRYHTATWSGSSEQKLFVNGIQIGGAKYDYSGFDHVNGAGTITDTHVKDFSAQCDNPANHQYLQIQGNDLFGASFQIPFKGYYGMPIQFPGLLGTPHILCDSSSIPYAVVGNIAINGTFDKSDLWGSAHLQGSTNIGISNYEVVDALTRSSTDTGTSEVIVTPYCPQSGVAYSFVSRPSDYLVAGSIEYTNNYSCLLSDEYTDAEALTNARVILGNSTVAQNAPRTTGFISTFTGVVFTLSASNLVNGQNYLVKVDFWDQNTAVITTRAYGFTGDSTGIHSITDVVPTPAVGHRLQVRNPRISFVTP